MSSREGSEFQLSVAKDEAFEAVLGALPKDAVVRDDDDGVGRFAGPRTVAVIGIGRRRISLYEGTWGVVKGQLDDPPLEVEFEERDEGVTVRIKKAPEKKRGLGSYLSDILGQMVTVAAIVVAYHFVRSIPIDKAWVAGISAVGGLAWFAIGFVLPKKKERSLEDLVRDALSPLSAEEE